jgi:uncharacterized membrane protein HdeD (DUF308 family)
MSPESAAQAMRDAMRETVRRHSLWYLIQGTLMVLAGLLALNYPVVSSVAAVLLLGWVLIISGVFRGISLIGAQHVPHFWLQLVSVGPWASFWAVRMTQAWAPGVSRGV